jgi:peptidoglycan-N-acetylglucosamine deacetylase
VGGAPGKRTRQALFVAPIALALAWLVTPYTGSVTTARALDASRRAAATSTTSTSTTTTTTTRPQRDVAIPPVENGLAPVLARLPTQQPVVFLGIDDGAHRQPYELELLRQHGVRASLYLANSFIHAEPEFFVPFVRAGYPVQNHSLTHTLMPRLSYAEQVREICGSADLQAQQFGARPIFFRPPGGAYNTATRRAAATCGMRAIVTWIAKANAGRMEYQLGHALRPGDIVLMHFRPEFRADLQAFVDALAAAGLRTELLEDWVD